LAAARQTCALIRIPRGRSETLARCPDPGALLLIAHGWPSDVSDHRPAAHLVFDSYTAPTAAPILAASVRIIDIDEEV
jgi:hypothetical protein